MYTIRAGKYATGWRAAPDEAEYFLSGGSSQQARSAEPTMGSKRESPRAEKYWEILARLFWRSK